MRAESRGAVSGAILTSCPCILGVLGLRLPASSKFPQIFHRFIELIYLGSFIPAKIPAIFHGNSEPRYLPKYFFQIRDFKSGIIVHPKVDILHIDKS
jgi:hypothetical protein